MAAKMQRKGEDYDEDEQKKMVMWSRLHATTTSNTATISKNTPSASASYTSYALPRYEYFMHCTASVGSLHVEGRYTP